MQDHMINTSPAMSSGPTTKVGDPRLPAYARIRDSLAARIAAREWESDAVIPSEAELATEYGTSVNTLRRATEQLVREGLLERRQGAGTYVRRPSFDASLFRWFHFTGLDGAITVPESRILKRTRTSASDQVAQKLGITRHSSVLHVLRLRLWAGQPVVVEDLYFPLPLFEELVTMPEQEIGPLLYPLYERKFSCLVSQVEDDISIGTAKGKHAMLLGLNEGEPIAIIERSSMRLDGSVIEWRRAHGRADRFHYRLRMR
jgi:GntR family transcriptional regulator